MALDPFINFGDADVDATGYDASATAINLASGHGARWAALTPPFNVTWYNSTDYPNPSDDPNREIVRVTARSTDALTVTRGQESITATTKNTAGKTYRMLPTLTAKTLNTDLPATYAALAGAAFTGAVSVTSTGTPGVNLIGDGGASSLYQDTYSASVNSVYRYRRSRGTLAAPLRAKSGDNLGNAQWFGTQAADDVSAASFTGSASGVLRVLATEDFTSTGRGAKFEFATNATGATSSATRLTVDSGGILFPASHGVFGTTALPFGLGTATYASLDSSALTLSTGVTLTGTTALALKGGTNSAYVNIFTANVPASGGLGGSDQNQNVIQNVAQADTGTNYFNPVFRYSVTDGSNASVAFENGVEGKWTNAGGYTIRRFYLWDPVSARNIFKYDAVSSPNMFEFGEFGTGNGVRVQAYGQTLSTDTDGEVMAFAATGEITKNDTNTRTFYGNFSSFILNTGGSNANTTVHLDDVGTTNTATTGLTTTLWRRSYGGSELARLTSAGFLGIGTASPQSKLHIEGASGWIVQDEQDTNPTTTELDSLDSVAVYNKANKFVIAYNNGGTMTYITIPLDGTTTTWTHSTSAP